MNGDYERKTVHGYQGADRAARYRRQYVRGFRWARFTMWREMRLVGKALREMSLEEESRVLDAPCGAGVAAGVLGSHRLRIVGLDASREMMDLARSEYAGDRLDGLVQGDLEALPFPGTAFDAAVVLGLMHRLPPGTRARALSELRRVVRRGLVVSFTVDSWAQRSKRAMLRRISSWYVGAPAPMEFAQVCELLRAHGFELRGSSRVAPFLSGEAIFWADTSRERTSDDSTG